MVVAVSAISWELGLGREAQAATDAPHYAQELLRSPAAGERARGVELLAHDESEASVSPLLQALGDPEEEVRKAARNALQSHDGKIIAEQLPAELARAKGMRRAYMIAGVVPMKREVGPHLVAVLADKHASLQVVKTAVEVVTPMRLTAAAAHLERLAWSADAELSLSAAQALSAIASEAADDAFVGLTRHPSDRVRSVAIGGLITQKHPDRVGILSEIAGGTREPSDDVRRAAITAAAQLERPTAVPLLIELLARNQRMRRVIRAHLIRLTDLDLGPEATPWLQWWETVRPRPDAGTAVSPDGSTVVRQQVGPAGQ